MALLCSIKCYGNCVCTIKVALRVRTRQPNCHLQILASTSFCYCLPSWISVEFHHHYSRKRAELLSIQYLNHSTHFPKNKHCDSWPALVAEKKQLQEGHPNVKTVLSLPEISSSGITVHLHSYLFTNRRTCYKPWSLTFAQTDGTSALKEQLSRIR